MTEVAEVMTVVEVMDVAEVTEVVEVIDVAEVTEVRSNETGLVMVVGLEEDQSVLKTPQLLSLARTVVAPSAGRPAEAKE